MRTHTHTHTVLTPAALGGGVAVVTRPAGLAAVALGVVQAFEAGARLGVTGPRVLHVDVAVALAGQAAPTGHLGVPEVPGGALVTPGTCRRKQEVSDN